MAMKIEGGSHKCWRKYCNGCRADDRLCVELTALEWLIKLQGRDSDE